MSHIVDTASCRDWESSSRLEWCLPNGIGGYAMGTVSGANTRRYHGLFVSATEPPAVRTVLLSNLEAFVSFGPEQVGLSTNQYVRAIHPEGYTTLLQFENLEDAAVWTHQVNGETIIKTVRPHPGVNAVTISYENRGTAP